MPNKIKVQVVDMDKDTQQFAEDRITEAFENHSREEVIANEIKKTVYGNIPSFGTSRRSSGRRIVGARSTWAKEGTGKRPSAYPIPVSESIV